MTNFQLSKLAIVGALSLLTLIGCGGKKSSSNRDTTVTSSYTMPYECRQEPNRSPRGSAWAYYRHFGFSEYESNRHNRDDRHDRRSRDRDRDRHESRRRGDGCEPSAFAACAPGIGLVCAPNRSFRRHQIVLQSYSFDGQGLTSLGLVCRLDNPASCSGVGVCQPVARDSVLGVCVR